MLKFFSPFSTIFTQKKYLFFYWIHTFIGILPLTMFNWLRWTARAKLNNYIMCNVHISTRNKDAFLWNILIRTVCCDRVGQLCDPHDRGDAFGKVKVSRGDHSFSIALLKGTVQWKTFFSKIKLVSNISTLSKKPRSDCSKWLQTSI